MPFSLNHYNKHLMDDARRRDADLEIDLRQCIGTRKVIFGGKCELEQIKSLLGKNKDINMFV